MIKQRINRVINKIEDLFGQNSDTMIGIKNNENITQTDVETFSYKTRFSSNVCIIKMWIT